MTKRIFAASYERGVQLIDAGCPIPYPDTLPRHPIARRNLFHAEQLDGYAESRVYAVGPLLTVYVIGLRLWTDRSSGTTFSDWSFDPPWADHLVSWDYEPADIIPGRDRDDYTRLLDSRLMGVMNDHRALRRGYPVEGLLCGCSSQPVPETRDIFVAGKLILVDDLENTVALRIALATDRPAASWSHKFPMDAGRRLDRMHERVSHAA
jgi:hypothetical protein